MGQVVIDIESALYQNYSQIIDEYFALRLQKSGIV